MSGREMDFIREAFEQNWVVPMGPNVNGFESDLECFVNRRGPGADGRPQTPLDKKVCCLSAGTAAVHLALLGCGVGPGDEVIVQSFTFCASSHPVTYLGATPVFVDSEPPRHGTWTRNCWKRPLRTASQKQAASPRPLYRWPYTGCRIRWTVSWR